MTFFFDYVVEPYSYVYNDYLRVISDLIEIRDISKYNSISDSESNLSNILTDSDYLLNDYDAAKTSDRRLYIKERIVHELL